MNRFSKCIYLIWIEDYSLIQQTFIECLLCVRHSFSCWDNSREQNRKKQNSLLSWSLYSRGGRVTTNTTKYGLSHIDPSEGKNRQGREIEGEIGFAILDRMILPIYRMSREGPSKERTFEQKPRR